MASLNASDLVAMVLESGTLRPDPARLGVADPA
jgi:hypothetical protein